MQNNNSIPQVLEATDDSYIVELSSNISLSFILHGTTAELVCAFCLESQCIIPSQIQYKDQIYDVTAIGNHAFFEDDEINTVIIPDTVTEIGENAFIECINLQTVRLSKSLTTIGEKAFYRCVSLSKIEFPDTLTSIGEKAFFKCSLSEIEIPSSVAHIGEAAFSFNDVDIINQSANFRLENDSLYDVATHTLLYVSCKKCGRYVMPDAITIIGAGAFDCCDHIDEIIIPDTVTEIHEGAFANCSMLSNLVIPASVSYIGNYAFNRCESLSLLWVKNPNCEINRYHLPRYTTVLTGESPVDAVTIKVTQEDSQYVGDLPDNHTVIFDIHNEEAKIVNYSKSIVLGSIPGYIVFNGRTYPVTAIGSHAFGSSIKNITLPNTIKTIEDEAFIECEELLRIDIPNSVTHIGASAFSNCCKMKHLSIPESVVEIGVGAFGNHMIIDCQSPNYIVENNALYTADKTTLCCIADFDTKFSMPSTVTEILPRAFADCSQLEIVELSPSLRKIGDHAFQNCESLSQITLPDTLIEIGAYAFAGCLSLTELTIPQSVSTIGEFAFLETVKKVDNHESTIPQFEDYESKFEKYDNFIFEDDDDSMNEEEDRDTGYNENAIESCPSISNLQDLEKENVVYDKDEKYLIYTIPLINHSPHFVLENGILYNASRTKLIHCPKTYQGELVLPNTLVELPASCFDHCLSITKITLPDTITTISSETFNYCISLAEVILPKALTEIKDRAFCGCHALSHIDIPDTVTYIGDFVFAYCTSLTEIVIPNAVTYIGGFTFGNCKSLTKAILSDSLTGIASNLFGYCTSLVEVSFSDSIEIIASEAFENCESLTTLPPLKSVQYIAHGAFWHCTSLSHIEFSDNLTDIELDAFIECSALTKVVIPPSVTSIPEATFAGCSSLAEVVIPDSVTYIGYRAFAECESLTQIVIPDSVTKIEAYAFYHCMSLSSIVLSKSITRINEYTFQGCPYSEVVIPASVTKIDPGAFLASDIVLINHSPNYVFENNALYTADRKELCYVPTNIPGEFVVPESVRMIWPYAFFGCIFSKIVVHSKVEQICIGAFDCCEDMTELVLPSKYMKIRRENFYQCYALTKITQAEPSCDTSRKNSNEVPQYKPKKKKKKRNWKRQWRRKRK